MSKKIYLDAGHGGHDPGASSNGLREKDVVLTICKKIHSKLKNYNCDVIMSRTNDTFKTLKERTNEANKKKADVFLSVHVNAGGGTGFESYAYSGKVSTKTLSFQNAIHDEIMKAIGSGVRDRKKKRANFHVLRESKMSACLTENLFIDTKSDRDKLHNDDFLDKVAEGHAKGLIKFLDLKKTGNSGSKVSDSDTVYRVVSGSYRKKSNADKQVERLNKAGFDAFIDIK